MGAAVSVEAFLELGTEEVVCLMMADERLACYAASAREHHITGKLLGTVCAESVAEQLGIDDAADVAYLQLLLRQQTKPKVCRQQSTLSQASTTSVGSHIEDHELCPDALERGLLEDIEEPVAEVPTLSATTKALRSSRSSRGDQKKKQERGVVASALEALGEKVEPPEVLEKVAPPPLETLKKAPLGTFKRARAIDRQDPLQVLATLNTRRRPQRVSAPAQLATQRQRRDCDAASSNPFDGDRPRDHICGRVAPEETIVSAVPKVLIETPSEENPYSLTHVPTPQKSTSSREQKQDPDGSVLAQLIAEVSGHYDGLDRFGFEALLLKYKIFQKAGMDELRESLFRLFERDGNGQVDVSEMTRALAVFQKGDKREKLKLIFQIYDRDGNGRVSRNELTKIMRSVVVDTRKLLRATLEYEASLQAAVGADIKDATLDAEHREGAIALAMNQTTKQQQVHITATNIVGEINVVVSKQNLLALLDDEKNEATADLDEQLLTHLVDDAMQKHAIENNGVLTLDEIDKWAGATQLIDQLMTHLR